MNIEQIKKIIQDYEELEKLTIFKIKVIESLDNKYNTSRGIENISFYGDDISVTCNDTCMGCYDSLSFNFPLNWLSKTDSELGEIVIMEKELRVERERKLMEERILNEKKRSEERELEQYKKLKSKFEN